jgi:hypothetical protein
MRNVLYKLHNAIGDFTIVGPDCLSFLALPALRFQGFLQRRFALNWWGCD